MPAPKQGYVEEVNPERLLETAVVSMLRTLDPYTEYQVCVYGDKFCYIAQSYSVVMPLWGDEE